MTAGPSPHTHAASDTTQRRGQRASAAGTESLNLTRLISTPGAYQAIIVPRRHKRKSAPAPSTRRSSSQRRQGAADHATARTRSQHHSLRATGRGSVGSSTADEAAATVKWDDGWAPAVDTGSLDSAGGASTSGHTGFTPLHRRSAFSDRNGGASPASPAGFEADRGFPLGPARPHTITHRARRRHLRSRGSEHGSGGLAGAARPGHRATASLTASRPGASGGRGGSWHSEWATEDPPRAPTPLPASPAVAALLTPTGGQGESGGLSPALGDDDDGDSWVGDTRERGTLPDARATTSPAVVSAPFSKHDQLTKQRAHFRTALKRAKVTQESTRAAWDVFETLLRPSRTVLRLDLSQVKAQRSK